MIVNLILGISIALLPLYLRILEIDFNRECKDYLFVAIMSLCIVLLPQKKRQLSGYCYFAFAYFIVMGALNQWNVASVSVTITSFTFYIGTIFILRFTESFDIDTAHFIFNGMILGSVIQGSLAIAGYFGFPWYYELLNYVIGFKYHTYGTGGFASAMGSLGNVNLLSAYLCLCIPAYYAKKQWAWLSPIPIMGLVVSHGRMGIISLLAGCIYFWLMKYNIISKAKVYISSIAVMLILPITSFHWDSGRFEAWKLLLRIMDLKHWLIGKGLGWFADANMPVPKRDTILTMEHNGFLTLLNSFGLMGFLVLSPIFYRFLKSKDRYVFIPSLLFTIFCLNYGHFALQQSTVMIIIMPLICIYGGIKNEHLS